MLCIFPVSFQIYSTLVYILLHLTAKFRHRVPSHHHPDPSHVLQSDWSLRPLQSTIYIVLANQNQDIVTQRGIVIGHDGPCAAMCVQLYVCSYMCIKLCTIMCVQLCVQLYAYSYSYVYSYVCTRCVPTYIHRTKVLIKEVTWPVRCRANIKFETFFFE